MGAEPKPNRGDRSPSSQVVGPTLVKRRRNLPHWQQGGNVYFISFSAARGPLPENTRSIVCNCIRHDHGKKYILYVGVVMPDHVHMLIQPLEKRPHEWFDLSEIMHGIKSTSAHRINQLCRTSGRVWYDESFDRIVRSRSDFEEKWRYITTNPQRAGLVSEDETYRYFVLPEDAA